MGTVSWTGWLGRVSPRRWVQAASLVLANAYFLSWLRWMPCGFLNCSNCAAATFTCPLAWLQRGAIFTGMGMLAMNPDRVLGPPIAALAVLAFFGAAVGSWTCGWVCPTGTVQDLLYKIPSPKLRLAPWAGRFRVPLLVGAVVAIPYVTGSMFFCNLCPPGTLTRLTQEALGIPLFLKSPEGLVAAASVAVLILSLLLSVVFHRFFCAVLCPIGGLYGLFNRISGFSLEVDAAKCTSCRRCERRCPQGLAPHLDPSQPSCNRCLTCTGGCDALGADVRI